MSKPPEGPIWTSKPTRELSNPANLGHIPSTLQGLIDLVLPANKLEVGVKFKGPILDMVSKKDTQMATQVNGNKD